MASGGKKQNCRAPRVGDEESKLQQGDSGRIKLQRHAPSEGTVNGFAQSRSGSNDLSDDDVEILEISDPEKEVEADVHKKVWKTKGSTAKDCSVTAIDKQQTSDDVVAISVSDSEEEVKSLKVSNKEEERKRAIKKGKEKADEVAVLSESSFDNVKKSGSAVEEKRNKMKKPRRKNIPVPVPCIAWRTRSFRNQQRVRVKYTQFFGKGKVHSDSDTSDSYSTWESLSESLESDERKEEESESESKSVSESESESGSDCDASSDSVTEAKSFESDEGAPPVEKKRRFKGNETKRRRVPPSGAEKWAPPLRKVAGEDRDVEEPAECAVLPEDSEDIPVPARKKKTKRPEMPGEGCSWAQHRNRDEWASLAEMIVPSSDESDDKGEPVAKKTRCEKEKPVIEKEKQVGGSTRAKRKRVKQPVDTKDLLDYIMNMLDCEAERVSEGSEHEVDRNAPQELPLVFDWKDEEPPVEKSEFEELVDEAWLDFDNALAYEEIGTYNPQQEKEKDSVHSNHCPDGNHDMYLDEEIGYLCRKCSYVETEIRHILPVFAPKGRNAAAGPNTINAKNLLHYGDLQEQNATCEHSEPFCKKNGSVWDLIPGVFNTMYPHQREAFEFIWKNLAGGIELDKLKRQDTISDDLGGCVISHAPGTGKTRLAIVFIQSYMKAFPNCKPIVFAPASIMNTWETEFKKWDFDLPFHNMNSEDLTGKEDTKIVEMTRGEPRTMQLARAIKLCSWVKGNGVLGMSYDLFREYALGKSSADSKERELLLEKPGLIVLDEGHTPRNDRSRLWKAFNEVQTEKRIILSGTPFQNTFLELHNTLCLVRPRFAQRFAVPIERSEWAMKKKKQTKDVWNTPTKNATGENADKVRSVLKPFVHVHAGDILKSLPGLRECVIMLNPEPIQREAIQNLSLVNNSGTFDSEYKTSLASIHPFLLTTINKIKEGEASLLNMDLLKSLHSDPYAGVKTKFVVEFVRMLKSDPLKERVLIFSQYIEPLNLIKEQLVRMFQWTEETEVLQIYGKILANERQRFINSFNDMSSNARVLLASTRACSEGISLTGASRVIMLDVVWNPAVGKQALSRAFRIGQEKVVYTYNLITTGTGEMEKYDVQGKKDKLSKLVFTPEAEASNAGLTRGLVAEDQLLEKLTSNEKLKGMFSKIYYTKSDD